MRQLLILSGQGGTFWGEISVLYLVYRGRSILIMFTKILSAVYTEGTFSIRNLDYFKRKKKLSSSYTGDSDL